MEKILRVERVFADGAEYKYELISREMDEKCVGAAPRYSIRIEMLCYNRTTEASTDFIFTALEDALGLYEVLRDNLVTPINLEYVLTDERIVS